MKQNPYSSLPHTSFWRNAVSDVAGGGLPDLWAPRFPMTRSTRVVTAGSCFAQHISRALVKSGFSWIDSEPAPTSVDRDQAAVDGYGIFSFRTGNIYTPARLKQWIAMALGAMAQPNEIFEDGGRYYDPLRPGIPAAGFAAAEELFAARAKTLSAISSSLREADVFIFTLGLTEAWKNKDNVVYPVCPGTLRGDFDPVHHSFVNFSYAETRSALEEALALVRSHRPGIRFLLTVSPVPLTATAAGDHVLPATTYSKSVLRAVAGDLRAAWDDVDYFPSYELITSPLFRGRFFESNHRTVTEDGVAFVMHHFLSALDRKVEAEHPPVRIPVVEAPSAAPQEKTDLVCEEIVLEQWSRTRQPSSPTSLLLVGDSHIGMLKEALETLGHRSHGGAVMWGSQWHRLQFVTTPTQFFVPTDPEARTRWQEIWNNAGPAAPGVEGGKYTILTNIGAHSHMLLPGFLGFLNAKYGRVPPNIEIDDVRRYLTADRMVHLNLLLQMVEAGHRVVWLSDPPAQVAEPTIHAAFDEILCEYVGATGARPFYARRWVEERGGWGEAWRCEKIDPVSGQPDAIHGSPAYYQTIAAAILEEQLK